MKQNIPDSQVAPGHPDFGLLTALAGEITSRAGGALALEHDVPAMLRQCVDDVIMTPKTGRISYDELEKTEKTYIGTRVEIELLALLNLPRGRLDTVILGHDVDIKNTMGSNWMIPVEAYDAPCVLVATDEKRSQCYLGLIVARPDYLTAGENRDGKRSISAEGFKNILWLLKAHPCPANFWHHIDPAVVKQIFAGETGNERVAELFRLVQRKVISREVVEAVARQKDFMRRLRSDHGSGARDELAKEQILLLSGHTHRQLIAMLGLPACGRSDFVSCHVDDAQQNRVVCQSNYAPQWPVRP